MKEKIEEFNIQLSEKEPQEILEFFINKFPEEITQGSSLGLEDQVLTDMIVSINKNVKIFTLDTGRLFPETYELIDKTNKKYGITIDTYFPNAENVEKMVKEKGINLFYESSENRKLCCYIRKLEPSHRALKDMKVWITGIRKDQTVSRFFNKVVEWDADNGLMKINPLLNWNEKQVKRYIQEKNIPYNSLHDKGFPSIGCQPCTRAVNPGEDIRSGRWWWEQPEQKECGLHNNPKRKAVSKTQ